MALESDPAHLGDIGDREANREPDIDRIYERRIKREREDEKGG